VRFTIIGGSGFVGGALAQALIQSGHDVSTPARDTVRTFALRGHVIYAAGVTADFRQRPFHALEGNTTLVAELLSRGGFDSFLYLSTARLYRKAQSSVESTAIPVRPDQLEDLYDLTKLAAEAICHASGRPNVRIVRLSNVVGRDFGSSNFLFDLIRSACTEARIELRTTLASAKDYVLLEDVLDILPRIATGATQACYNLGSGANLTNAQLAQAIVGVTGAQLSVQDGAPTIISPPIDISRLQSEFAYAPRPILPMIPSLVDEFRRTAHAQN
jgi:nucleoside-diphosphate-sugar epimerase